MARKDGPTGGRDANTRLATPARRDRAHQHARRTGSVLAGVGLAAKIRKRSAWRSPM
jgi:hypothetical protein